MLELWILSGVILGIIAAGGGLRAWGLVQRRRALGVLPDDATRLRGFTMRVLARGRHGLPGVTSSRPQRTTGDLGYTEDRLVISSNRGPLVDLRADAGRLLTSVRTTGPGKVVIEGQTPGASGSVGSFRLELRIPEPRPVVDALQRFVRPPDGAPAYGSLDHRPERVEPPPERGGP